MARDMAKKYITDRKWAKENTFTLCLRVRNDSGIPNAIGRVKSDGISANSYAIQALREKLIRDGYLSAEPQPPEE